MSKTVDERVVSMQFDNKNFETNVKTSLNTLDELKQSLKLTDAAKGLENVNAAANKMDMSNLSNSVDGIKVKFSALQVAATTALANITNSALNAGKRIAAAITIEPIKMGFSEYETQIGAIQTILANTQSKGSTLQDVNSALDELNTYADKTIYNFTEMTKNIGTFTAAGVDLDKSVTSIKGIANLAAVSGSTSMQASQAMYQLSQALAAGKVSLMDWNSVVNAGMGGEVFQTALKRTATQMGYNVDALIKKYGSFRESLTQGQWLTTEVLTETLTQLSGAYSEADLIAQGYSKKQAQEIVELAETAVSAATDVKTFTQLIDTSKEALQSGWTQSWETILGDFGEAKELFTDVSKTLGDMISASADARNQLLSEGLSTGWKQLLNSGIKDETGYIETVKKVAKEHGIAIDDMIEKSGSFTNTLKDGWLSSDMIVESVKRYQEQISKMSVEERKAAGYTQETLTELEALSNGLQEGTISAEDFAKKMARSSGRENMIDALKNSFDALMSVIKPIKEAFREVFPPATGEQLYDLTTRIKEFSEGLKPTEETLDKIKRASKGVFSAFDLIGKGIKLVLSPITRLLGSDGVGSLGDMLLDLAASIGDFFTSWNEGVENGTGFQSLLDGLSNGVDGISNALEKATGGIKGLKKNLSSIANWVGNAFSKIGDAIGKAFGWITENVSIGDVFAGLAGGGIFVLLTKLANLIGKVSNAFSNLFGNKKNIKKIVDQFKDILDSIHGSLESFTTGIKVSSLVSVAIAVGILSASVSSLAKIDAPDIGKSLFAIASLLVMLTLSFRSLTKSLSKFDSKGVLKSSVAMIAMASAIKILADAIVSLSGLSFGELAQGLVALIAGLFALIGALKVMEKINESSLKNAITITILSIACKTIAEALSELGNLSWDQIARGLIAMGGALTELVAATTVLSKFSGEESIIGSLSIVIMVLALKPMAKALQEFGSMSWDEIGRGLVAMGGALVELGVISGVLGYLAGASGLLGALSIVIGVIALKPLATALQEFGSMSWDEIGRGLVAMGGALVELGVITGVLGYVAGAPGLLGAATILIGVIALKPLADALQQFGSMSWEEIGKGLVAMGGALVELGVITGVLGYVAGAPGLLGAATILIAVQSLDPLATALQKFGSMSWDEIGRGLVSMGAAMGELALISSATGLTGLAGLVGAGTINLAVQGLDDLANALIKFGSMSWEQIEQGLAAMGAAMGETALGGLLNTFSGLGASSIATIAAPLGTLADSVSKWTTVKVPDDLGEQLGKVASGIRKFFFTDIGAGGLSEVASPLGTLADSIAKWSNVTVPEGLADSLGEIADGVGSFAASFSSGWAMGDVVGPLGDMAGAVSKWSNVTIPAGLGDGLSSVANGVNSFSSSFAGGWAIEDIVEPFGNLADSIAKWSNVTIPENLGDGLSSIADGVGSFAWLFSSGWAIGDIAEPLGNLADSIKKWIGVSIPENFGANLKAVSDGISQFSLMDATKFSAIDGPLNTLSTAFVNFSGITSTGSNLVTYSNNIKTCFTNLSGMDTYSVNNASLAIDKLVGMFSKINNSSFNNVGAFVSAANQLNSLKISDINVNSENLNSSINSIKSAMDSMSKAISSSKGSMDSSMETATSGLKSVIDSKSKTLVSSIESIISSMERSIDGKKSSITKSFKSIVSDAVDGIKSNKSSFTSAGKELGEGLVIGVKAKYKAAYNAGYELGKQAVQGERDGQNSASPSKDTIKSGKWLGEGLVIGVDAMGKSVYKAGYQMGNTATKSISKAISSIPDILNSDMDMQPTIHPIMDLSDVTSGVNSMNRMLNMNPSVGVLSDLRSIGRAIDSNRNDSTEEVVSTLKDLKKTLNDKPTGDTYIVDGITYDDGSNVSTAVKTLIRATRIEGRA